MSGNAGSHHRQPTAKQRDAARAAYDAVAKSGASVAFRRFEEYGSRVELVAPKNKGRVPAEVRESFRRWQWAIEILTEQRLEKMRFGIDSPHAAFVARAVELFPGARTP